MAEFEQSKSHRYSRWIMASFGAREMFGEWINGAFGFAVYYFYEAVIGLQIWMAGLAFILYSIWNAINDPLMGYLMERIHWPWQKKSGMQRFPIIIFGAITWLASYLLIFLVPTKWVVDGNQWRIFTWYLVTLCIYDTVLTIYEVNVLALYPDKFQDSRERRVAQGFGTVLGITGIVLAALIPPMWVTKELESYRTMALLSVAIGFLLLLIILPGIYEDKHLREIYKKRNAKITTERKNSFFKTAKLVFSNRNFVGKIVFHFGYYMSATFLQTSAFYVLVFLLNRPETDLILLMAPMLTGAILSTPIWALIANKVDNNKNVIMVAGILMTLSFLPLIFVNTIIGWMIGLFFFGIALGGQWFMDPPTFADVLDDAAVKTGFHQHSVYIGYQTFIVRFAGAFQAIIFSVVHILTTFPEGVNTLEEFLIKSENPSLAVFGIRLHATIIPAIVILITLFVFWNLYTLTPEKVKENKSILAQ
ncbi:MAG: MFS transporter [Candidatus Lokiarchaeota archaeon]|nr:MFS transporter [Candidatus Lokiarchaeota archaeon]